MRVVAVRVMFFSVLGILLSALNMHPADSNLVTRSSESLRTVDDYRLLDGVWIAQSIEVDGITYSLREGQLSCTHSFRGKCVSVRMTLSAYQEVEEDVFEFWLDGQQEPKWITFQKRGFAQRMHGIYRIENNVLILAQNICSTETRPVRFLSESRSDGSNFTVTRLTRQ